jgi:hypothetical protein
VQRPAHAEEQPVLVVVGRIDLGFDLDRRILPCRFEGCVPAARELCMQARRLAIESALSAALAQIEAEESRYRLLIEDRRATPAALLRSVKTQPARFGAVVSGLVTDHEGHPLEQGEVAWEADGRSVSSRLDRGTYALPGLAVGQQTLWWRREGEPWRALGEVSMPKGSWLRRDWRIAP